MHNDTFPNNIWLSRPKKRQNMLIFYILMKIWEKNLLVSILRLDFDLSYTQCVAQPVQEIQRDHPPILPHKAPNWRWACRKNKQKKIEFKTFSFTKKSRDRWRMQDFGTCNLGIGGVIAFESFNFCGFFFNFCKIGARLKAFEAIFKMRSFATFQHPCPRR